MRDVAVVAFAQTDHVRREQAHNEVEMLMPVLHRHEHLDLVVGLLAPDVVGLGEGDDRDVTHQTCSR